MKGNIMQVTNSKTLVAAYIAGLGNWLGIATGAPGSTQTPSNEATGGGYARAQSTWSAGAAGVQNGTATSLTLAAATYTYALVASASTVAAANMIDNIAITSTQLSQAGQIILTPSITVT